MTIAVEVLSYAGQCYGQTKTELVWPCETSKPLDISFLMIFVGDYTIEYGMEYRMRNGIMEWNME